MRRIIESASCRRQFVVAVVGFGLVAVVSACGPRQGEPPPVDTTGTASDEGPTGSDGPGATSTNEPPFEPIACTPSGVEATYCNDPSPPGSWFICAPPHPSPHPLEGTANCVSLWCHEAHCGECGRQCEGRCYEGLCGSFGSPCVEPEDDLRTCAEVCSHFGHACEDRLTSESGHEGCSRGYVFALADSFTGNSRCPSGFGAQTEHVRCDEPIRWDHGTDEQPQTGIACCCKGET